jgi:hypothetical protein
MVEMVLPLMLEGTLKGPSRILVAILEAAAEVTDS